MNNIISETLEIKNISCCYGSGRTILDDVSVSVGQNEFIAIIGQNGSGKTTMLKTIAGLLRPFAGTVSIGGRNTDGMTVAEIAGKIGFVMQDPDRQLFEQTVYDETAFALKSAVRRGILTPKQMKIKTEEALAAVGLSEKRGAFPHALCRADRVKTVFAAVLAMGPGIIMLDEPLAGQDYRGRMIIMDLVNHLYAGGYTIIIVTHNVIIAAEYARRIIVMKDSRLYMDGPPRDIFYRHDDLEKAGILAPEIIRLSQQLKKTIPIADNPLSPAEMAKTLAGMKGPHFNRI